MPATHFFYLAPVNKLLILWLALVVSVVPNCAFAVDTADTQLLPMGLKVTAALSVVLGLMLLIYAVLKKSGRWIRSGKESAIKLLEVRYLAPKKALYLIEVNGTKLLLSGTAGRLETLAQWQLPDDTINKKTDRSLSFDDELQQRVNTSMEHDSQ
ncbi:MAG: flagellar biosynthetic protein FliO [Desulfuromonas sp.]|nr:flagellar biosynthetic protein FliO [Desulfuromonas sp.]